MEQTIATFIALLDPSIFYDKGKALATFVAVTITPILLVIAISVRTSEEQLGAIVGKARWGVAIRDILGWTIVISLYFGLFNLFNDFFQSLYNTLGEYGSIKTMLINAHTTFDQLDSNRDDSWSDVFAHLSPGLLIGWVFYYCSLILLASVSLILIVAHAIGYSLIVAWGLIAIPMSITSSFKLLKGWGVFLAAIMIWPIIHFIIMGFFGGLIEFATSRLLSGADLSGSGVGTSKEGLYMLFTIFNLLLVAAVIAAPFIANSLANNSGSITGLVAPFTAAAIGAAGAAVAPVVKTASSALRTAGKNIGGLAGDGMYALGKAGLMGAGALANKALFTPSVSPNTAAPSESSNQSGASTPSTQHTSTASNTTPLSESSDIGKSDSPINQDTATENNEESIDNQGLKKSALGTAAMAGGHDTTPMAEPTNTNGTTTADQQTQKRQARRGAILNQFHNKGKLTLPGRK